MRTTLVGAVATGVSALVLAGAFAAPTLPPPVVARSIYVVRPDPRLCPSPLCGGYWVSAPNRARTRCHDGLFRPRCYVATAWSSLTREPLTTALPADGLIRAALGASDFPGIGKLGTMTVAEAWRPVGNGPASGDYFRVRDTGIRCVRAPCFSFRVVKLKGTSTRTISTLDLDGARPTAMELERAQAALGSPGGLFVLGKIVPTPDGGRALRAARFYLTLPPPRA